MKFIDNLKRMIARIRPEDPWASRLFVPRMQAGMNVNHDTAMTVSAVYRAISYISSQLAMMPWRVMVDEGDSKEIAATHPVDRLLYRRPNAEMSPFTFRELMVSQALSWGNGYAEIERDVSNRPTNLWPISPDRVEVKRIEGQVVYEISHTGQERSTLASRAIGLGMAAEQFGASFFQNGTSMSGVLEHPGNLSEGAVENLRNSWNDRYRGPGQAHKPVILEEGMKWSPISIPPDDAQFLETRQFQVDDIARWYGLPPHKLQSMEKATFSNIEHQSIEVVGDALQPWAKRLEEEADRKLFNQRSAYFTNIDMTELLRGDVKSRSEYYREMWNLGVLSINEIRTREGLNPIPDGDKRFVQLNMTTLEKAGEEPQEPEPEIEAEEEAPQMHVVFEVCNRIARRERHRLVDAAQRYSERADFVRWMDGFFSQHAEYAADQLEKAGIEGADLSGHILAARINMLAYYDAREDYPVADAAQSLTDELVAA